MPKKGDRPRPGVIAHLTARAMGLEDPCALVLTNGQRVPGPVKQLRPDRQIKPSATTSTLVVTTADGRDVALNDVVDVTLADGSPLPDSSGNSGVG